MNKELKILRRKITGMSEEFYDYEALTKHDYDLLLSNQQIIQNIRDQIVNCDELRRMHDVFCKCENCKKIDGNMVLLKSLLGVKN